MKQKKFLMILALLCAIAQGAWAQANWEEVYALTKTYSGSWIALDVGSTTGKTLGWAGTKSYYYASGNSLCLLGQGTVNATGGNAANGGNGGNGDDAYLISGNTILGGSGGTGGNGGGGAGAGVGTRGANGGAGGQRTGSTGQETTQHGVDGSAGSAGATAGTMDGLSVVYSNGLTLTATGGAAGSNGTGGGRGRTASQHPGSNVYMASGGGGGAGGFGGAASNIGTGGPGGGGGGGGAAGNVAWVVYSGTANGYYHAGAYGGKGGQNANGSYAPDGADVELDNPKHADIQGDGLRDKDTDYDDDDGWENGNGRHDGGSGGACGSASQAFVAMQGFGIQSNPFLINSKESLAQIATLVNSGVTDFVDNYFSLTCDLDLSGQNWTPIGTPEHPFRGNFYGNNHIISNLTVNNGSNSHNGLFGYVQGDCWYTDDRPDMVGSHYIQNIVLKDAVIQGGDYTGGVIGHVYGGANTLWISGLIFEGTVSGGNNYVGGLIGSAQTHISQSGTLSIDPMYPCISNCLFASGTISGNGSNKVLINVNGFNDCISGIYFANGVEMEEGEYATRIYPVTIDAPSTINCEFISGGGFLYDGKNYRPHTARFKLSYNDYQARVSSVKINGVEVGTDIGEYILNAGGNATSYAITVECDSPGIAGSGTENDPYIITNTELWDFFAFTVGQGKNYSGQFVRLADDIDITTTVGRREDRPFSGTFLGNGKTITANIVSTTSGTGANEQGVAPFHYVKDATIRDLKVAGTIASASYHTSGIVGFADGTNLIEGCAVTATLNVSSNYAGGIVGHGQNSTTTIRGCAFTGTINGVDEDRSNIGAIWGWSDSGTPTFVNCLEAGTYTNIRSMHPVGLQSGTGSITNCYYVTPQIGSPSNACTVTGATQAYAYASAPANLGDAVENGNYGYITAYDNGLYFDGKYYVAPEAISLSDNEDNGNAISNADGYAANVTLSGRTLYKDGAWNTICLPFNVVLDGSPLDGATARPLSEASISGSTLNLTFGSAVTTLQAGTPYIIKWDAAAENIVSPVFSGVTIDATDRSYDNHVSGDDRVRFLGTYKSTTFDGEDKSILFMGDGNKLYYPLDGATIGAQRAYFKIGGSSAAPRLTAFSIDFGDGGETTGIMTTNLTNRTNSADAWYTLDGRRLSQKPSRAGVYINKGNKVVIK